VCVCVYVCMCICVCLNVYMYECMCVCINLSLLFCLDFSGPPSAIKSLVYFYVGKTIVVYPFASDICDLLLPYVITSWYQLTNSCSCQCARFCLHYSKSKFFALMHLLCWKFNYMCVCCGTTVIVWKRDWNFFFCSFVFLLL
jgi:hypothetical protein